MSCKKLSVLCKVVQLPRIFFKSLFETQFEYFKFELSTKDGKFTTSPKHSDIGNRNVSFSPWIFKSLFSGFVS